jgi:hypothetical protein
LAVKAAADAKRLCECTLLGLPLPGVAAAIVENVVGVGVGRKVTRGQTLRDAVLRVYVKRKTHPLLLPEKDRIPAEVEGVPTDVVEVGELRVWWPFPPVFQRRLRPARPGVSLGHKDVTAGTFGLVVRTAGESGLILSNNHVLANENAAAAGDPILQPGRWDGGKLKRDAIAELATFVPLSDSENLVDAALARPHRAGDIDTEVLHVGGVAGTVEPELGTRVQKAGRTTRVTHGEVTDTDVTLRVGYSGGDLLFRDQFLVRARGAFSGPGDSGSAILDESRRVCGLLFAGSAFVTVANRWGNVARSLGVRPM